MMDLRLICMVLLSVTAVSGCSWVDSSGRQENQSPGLTELTQILTEDQRSVSLGLADPDRNLSKLDYVLLSEGGDLSAKCLSAGGLFADVDAADFATSLEVSCDATVDQTCLVSLKPELLSSEIYASDIPVLRRPVAQQYRLTLGDEDGASNEQILTLCIASESSAPIAGDDQFDIEYNATRVVDGVEFDANCGQEKSAGVLANDSDDFDYSEDDANGQQCLVARLETAPLNHQGVFTLESDGGFTYNSGTSLGAGQSDSFEYTVSDGINVSDVATVQINITGENSAPTSKDPMETIDEDSVLVLSVDDLAEDSGGGELILKNAVAPFPVIGTVEKLNNPARLRYTPDAEVSGSDSFGYRVEDAGGAFVDVTVTVTVTEVNDAPTIVAEQGNTLNLAVGTSGSLLFTVADVEDDANGVGITVNAVSDNLDVATALAAEEFDGATAGNWLVDFSGIIDGTATVTVTASDSGAVSNTVPMTVSVLVGNGNQAPTVQSPSPAPTTAIGSDLVLDLIADNIADDPDGANNNLVIDSVDNEVGGTVAFAANAQQLTFTPSNATGTASFDLTVEDEGGATATGTIVVDVTAAVTQAPVLSTSTLAATNGVTVTWSIVANALATDADSAVADLVFSGTPSSTGGTVILSADSKSIDFTPSATGATTIIVTIEDPDGNDVSGSLSVSVSAVANIPPTVAATTLTVIDGIPAEFALVTDVAVTDPDGLAATVEVDSFSSESGVTVASVSGDAKAFRVTSTSSAAGSFELVVVDVPGDTAQALITVDVNANQAPVASIFAHNGVLGNAVTVSKVDLGVSDADSADGNVVLSNPTMDSVPASSGVTTADLSLNTSNDEISFTPDLAGDYIVNFDVEDEVNTESYSFTVTVN